MIIKTFSAVIFLNLLSSLCFIQKLQAAEVSVGSKNFTESVVLGEMLAQLVEANSKLKVERRLNLAGSNFTFEALKRGEIDFYVEYTGTGLVTILKQPSLKNPKKVFDIVGHEFQKRYHINWLAPLGFNNTYALAVRKSDPRLKDIQTISELQKVSPQLIFGGPHEYMARPDGYSGLKNAYNLKFEEVIGLDPGLMYKAAKEKKVDVISAFSTDGRIQGFGLRVLKDNLSFFPPYQAAVVVRQQTLEKFPQLKGILSSLSGKILDQDMMQMNYQVDLGGRTVESVARQFLESKGLIEDTGATSTASISSRKNFLSYVWVKRYELLRLIKEHLYLVIMSMIAALLIGIPLGIIATRLKFLRAPLFSVINILQTIPSLALLGFMIPLFGIGTFPAIVALFSYALLPLVRNTYTGIRGVNASVIESAKGLGLTNFQILTKVELPLALPTIMAGFRTSTVIVIGTATLAALIGAGGLGDPIFRGIASVNNYLILLGALPAALLALILDKFLYKVEEFFVPKGYSSRPQ